MLFRRFANFGVESPNFGGIPVKRGDTVEALVWCENDDQIHVVGGLAKEGSKIMRPPSSHITGRIEPTFT